MDRREFISKVGGSAVIAGAIQAGLIVPTVGHAEQPPSQTNPPYYLSDIVSQRGVIPLEGRGIVVLKKGEEPPKYGTLDLHVKNGEWGFSVSEPRVSEEGKGNLKESWEYGRIGDPRRWKKITLSGAWHEENGAIIDEKRQELFETEVRYFIVDGYGRSLAPPIRKGEMTTTLYRSLEGTTEHYLFTREKADSDRIRVYNLFDIEGGKHTVSYDHKRDSVLVDGQPVPSVKIYGQLMPGKFVTALDLGDNSNIAQYFGDNKFAFEMRMNENEFPLLDILPGLITPASQRGIKSLGEIKK